MLYSQYNIVLSKYKFGVEIIEIWQVYSFKVICLDYY